MINSRVLEDLLQEPLGPYYDRDILHETVCQMRGTTQLVLYSFILEHNGHVTGLDASEHPLEGQDDRKFRFRGVLKIANPEWLSDFGVKTVEAELNLRAKERALRLGEEARWGRAPQLTVEELFGRHLTRSHDASHKEGETMLTVLIQGEKNMSANFMNFARMPKALLWSSKAHNRNYQIATMDEETYTLSKNFFWRWRLLALMKKIVELYPWVPLKKRTPGWYVDAYIERFSRPPEDKYRRLIFDEDDSDVDETGKTLTPRHLLKPHRNEILWLFAAQAEWFITDNAVRRNGLIDFASWNKFAEDVRKRKRKKAKEAHREAARRGEAIGQEPESSDQDEVNFSRLVKDHPVIGKSNETVVRKLELAQARPYRERRASISSGSGSEGDAPGGAVYASDFSEPSDAEEDDDSDHRLAEEEIVDRIPWQLQVPPSFPDVDGRWWCPLQECNYQIDLFDLTEEERRGTPRELVAYILQKEWRIAAYDMKVLQGFKCIVTNHYMKHLEDCGVRVERREGRTRFVFIDGRHRPQNREEHIGGPRPAWGMLGGESRADPIVHASELAG